jgi:hypothetical protein
MGSMGCMGQPTSGGCCFSPVGGCIVGSVPGSDDLAGPAGQAHELGDLMADRAEDSLR